MHGGVAWIEFQYPSSRVILPDIFLQGDHNERDCCPETGFNTPVVG